MLHCYGFMQKQIKTLLAENTFKHTFG